jgi:hypothetical protein
MAPISAATSPFSAASKTNCTRWRSRTSLQAVEKVSE